MTITPTQQPVPSTSPRDLKYNAGLVDEFVTSLALRYIDRFGQPHYTIEGLRELAMQAIASFGFVTIRSFEDGATLTTPNQVLLWEQEGDYFKWEGSFPKSVPANSSPYSTGGIAKGAWVSVGDAALRSMLSSSAGAAQIGTSTGNTVQQELSLLHVTANVSDPKFAGGAKGDWNSITQTGSDDTAAVQAAIDYLATLPNQRSGGSRVLKFPEGNFRIKNLVIPSGYDYGLDIIGESRDSTQVFIYNETDRNIPGVDCKIEYVLIDHISIYGSSKFQMDFANSCKVLFQVNLPDKRADVDIRVNPGALMGASETIFKIYGRGFIYQAHCSLAANLLEIACDGRNFDATTKATEGMRNYQISNTRFDNVSRVINITGDGPEKEYINSITMVGNDFHAVDRAILGPDANIQNCVISANNSQSAFGYGMIEVKSLKRVTITSNNLMRWFDRANLPPNDSAYMHGVVTCTASVEELIISNNMMQWNTTSIVTAGAASRGVLIVGNTFRDSFRTGNVANMFNGANCEMLNISNNLFYNGEQPTLTVNAWSSAQSSPSCLYENNFSSFGVNALLPFTYDVKFGTTTISKIASSSSYQAVQGRVKAKIQFSVSNTTGSGEVSVTLPVQPVADSSATSGYAGGGKVTFTSGITTNIYPRVLPGVGVVFIKPDGTSLKQADLTGNLTVIFEVDYKM